MAQSLGTVSDGQQAVLEVLCRAAETEMTGRPRDGVTPEDCGPAFVLGCAWLALSGLAGGQYGGVSSFTAGSVTIRKEESGQGRERAAALRLQAETRWLSTLGPPFHLPFPLPTLLPTPVC